MCQLCFHSLRGPSSRERRCRVCSIAGQIEKGLKPSDPDFHAKARTVMENTLDDIRPFPIELSMHLPDATDVIVNPKRLPLYKAEKRKLIKQEEPRDTEFMDTKASDFCMKVRRVEKQILFFALALFRG